MVKALKNFRFYVLHSHSMIYVFDTIVKSILTQHEVGCNNRGMWVAKTQEYDTKIKSMKLVRGKVQCKALAKNEDNEK